MTKFHYLLILSTILACVADLSDDLMEYDKQCIGEDRLHCSDGTCIWKDQYCDGKIDCLDGSDENLCLDHTPAPDVCNHTHHFLCADGKKCIPITWICNNRTDCPDGSDERNCTDLVIEDNNTTCNGFKCVSDQKCISPLWACDGAFDCADNSDEALAVCRTYRAHRRPTVHLFAPDESRCPSESDDFTARQYPCLDGGFCVHNKYMCNGMHDCKDGSDEGNFCRTWNVMCSTDICAANSTCYPDRDGPKCFCHHNFNSYNYSAKACVPVNMCNEGRPYCGQICQDIGSGAFHCLCEKEWLIDRLGISHVCIAPDPEAMLFFSTRNEIKYLTLKSKKIITVASGIKQAHGVNYDGTHVYWVETAHGHQSIVRARLDKVADTKQVVVGVGLEDPGDISFDWLNGLIYFGDAERGLIAACTPDGTMCTRIRTNARVPKFVTLNVRIGKMYWADWHQKSVIMSASMDGSDAKVLVDKLDSFPTGLALDMPSGRLYYVDIVLKGVNINNGKDFIVMEPSSDMGRLHQPYSLAVFENLIFWSDWTFNTIQSTEKLNGRHNSLITTLDSPVYGMHLYHPLLTKVKFNPCAEHKCSHFCLLKSNATYSCACPDGMELIQPQNDTCQEMLNYRPQYLIVAGGANFTRVQYNLLGHPGTQLTYFDIGRVQAMAYDSLRDTLFIYDAQRRSINYVSMSNFSRGISRVLVYRGLVNVVDMDYDYITDCLYLADAGRKMIEVVSLRTKKRALVHRFDDEIPISLCVIPEYGKMMLAVSEGDQPNNIHIDSFNLDGFGQQHMFMNNLKGPHIRLKYSRIMDNVYLADEGNSIIDHLHPLGTNRENYRELSTSVTNLAVTEMFVFWTDRRSSRLYWADIHDTSRTIRRIDLTIFPNTTHLHIQATNPLPAEIPDHPCQHNHCSHVCVQKNLPGEHIQSSSKTSLGYQCLCAPGFLLVGEDCKELIVCKNNESYCHGSNLCIPMSSVCDGKEDCQHGEDEDGCPNRIPPSTHSVCPNDEILCEDKCIPKSTICRTSTTTPGPIVCSSSGYECVVDKFCIEHAQVCNGVRDCSDGSDEAPSLCSTLTCLPTEFTCSVGNCIMASFRCDGEWDCDDGADELNCDNKTCAQDYYRCDSGECIELKRRCDRHSDCIDHSDEEDCDEIDVFDGKEEIENCEAWEHTCELNRSICIPLTARCNGIADCPGNTDEVDCLLACRNSGFMCKQEQWCISKSKVCDGVKHCPDGEDEWPDTCALVNKTSILYTIPIFPADECRDGYHCANGQCIEWRNVCDGQPNCFDGTDENGLCATACYNNTCSHTCSNTPLGARCRCPVGYTIGKNKHKCIDADECEREVCSQICHNTPGSFLCQCYKGYARRSDRRSCKATKGNMSILYVTGNSVRSITADGYISVEYNDSNAGRITDLDYDVRRRKLYVTSTETGTLVEVNNTHTEVIKNIGRPSRVAVDWITGNVYFIDSTPQSMYLRVCNVMRKRCARLQKLPSDSDVTALIIDPAFRRIFYCVTRDLESVLWSSTLAGTEATHIAVTHNCTGLAVDSYKKRLYVAETGPAHIVTMNYEGNMFKRLLTEDPHLESPHDLAIFEDHIYFLVANSFKLNRCLLFGEKKCELYLQRVFNANSFVIRHENVQRDDITDSCKDFACDNVCVAGNSVPVCLCDDGTISGSGKCPLVEKSELPLFNGWTYQDYQDHKFAVTLISCLAVLLAVYFGVFLYYHYVYKRRHQGGGYLPNFRVYFRNRQGSTDHPSSLSPITESATDMAASSTQSSSLEFVNPIQMFRNFRTSFRKKKPIGTAGLDINVPPLDVSDTESDLDDRELQNIMKKQDQR